MSQTYADELRTDSSVLVIPTVTVPVVFLALLTAPYQEGLGEFWPYIIVAMLTAAGGRLGYHLVQQEWRYWGILVFVFGHLLALGLFLMTNWQPWTPLPYLAGIFIVIVGMTVGPRTVFFVWGIASIIIIGAVGLAGVLTPLFFVQLLLPIGVNLLLAAAVFLSGVEWETAVEAASLLHRRAQQRRDELFHVQEEITLTNKKLEALNRDLEQARQAAEQERDLRTRFMNNVSHELRTPLNGIVNFAHIMREGACGPVTERQQDYLSRIESSGWHLLSVLNDLLDMAQIQSGEFRLYLEASNLKDICEEAMSSLRGLILDKENLQLLREYPQEWPTVYIDEMRIKQALINMLGNAAKYTEEGHIALRIRPFPNEVQIIIEDTGVGIAPEHHDVIFQEFRQVDEQAARRRIGTGLGLPITRHLIERHQGHIAVESDLGQGTKFIITLPISDPASLETNQTDDKMDATS